jgi:hypothetical protein
VTPNDRLERRLDAAAPFIVAAAVFAAAAAYSSQKVALDNAGPVRWVMLALLAVFAVARAAASRDRLSFPRTAVWALVVFCGLSLVSTGWSVHPHGTLGRAIAQAVVAGAFVLFAACSVSSPTLGRRLLDGVLLGATLVALAGFVYWLANPSRAMLPATTDYGARFRGFEVSPDTSPVLLAIAMPIAFWRSLSAGDRLRRVAFFVVLIVLAGSVVATGSRGGILAGFVALLVVAAFAPLSRARRAALAAVVVAGLVVAAFVTTLPSPLSAPPSTTTPAAPAAPVSSRDADAVLPLEQEIGNPWWTHKSGNDKKRSLFNGSVRLRALEGTVEQAAKRPLLGYGFAAEQWAFVNRYYAFFSGNPENGYAGILLQLGIVGLLAWLAVLAACVVPAIRACLRDAGEHPYALGALGAAAGALGMGLSQSFFHGPGGIAYVAFWTALLLCAGAGVTARRSS